MKTWQTLLIGLLALLTTQLRAQNVGIGTATPHPSARLHVEDNQRGILIPRLTTAQRNTIVGPARGLIIYNIDCDVIEYYDGSRWLSTQMEQNKQIFYFEGRTVQRVRVPCGVSQARIKVWGAGGGGGGWDVCNSGTGGDGGGGAFATAVVDVTPGHELEVYVGEGGQPGALYGSGRSAEGAAFGRGGWGYGSGGRGGASGQSGFSGGGGGGGGSSAVFNRTTNTLIIAAGGGGGGGGKGLTNSCQGGAGGAGGATGQNGATSSGTGGLGGGSATRDGTAGGDRVGDGGGGGGGGGGATNGGAGGEAATCDCGGGGGGGGNSFVVPTAIVSTITDGSSTTPGGTTDPDYLPGIGVGGHGAAAPPSLALPGGNGLVVIEWIR